MRKSVKRLYSEFKPSRYELNLTPDKSKMSFEGIVKVFGKKNSRPSKRLTFHQKDLIISKARVFKIVKDSKEEIKVSRVNTHNSYDELRIHLSENIYPGEYEIEIDFKGKITKK